MNKNISTRYIVFNFSFFWYKYQTRILMACNSIPEGNSFHPLNVITNILF